MVFFIDGFHVRLSGVGHVLYYHCNIAIVNVKLSHQGGSGGGHQIWVLLTFSKIAGALVQCQIVILLHAAGPVMTAKS